jgi:hypothetical protein
MRGGRLLLVAAVILAGCSGRPSRERAPSPTLADPTRTAEADRTGALETALRIAHLGPVLVQTAATPEKAEEAARALASPDAADRLAAAATSQLQAFRQAVPEGAWFYQGVLASRSSGSERRATVDLWLVQVWGGHEVPVSVEWVTLTIELTLESEGWRQIDERTKPGPWPTQGDLGEQLQGFVVIGGDDGSRP